MQLLSNHDYALLAGHDLRMLSLMASLLDADPLQTVTKTETGF